MYSHEVRWLQKVFTRVILEGRQQITALQSLPILSQVLISILGTTMIPFILTLTFSILLTLIFAIPGTIMCIRWLAMFVSENSEIGVGDMKVPTFYASVSTRDSETTGEKSAAIFICMPVVSGVFGGIHCVGWTWMVLRLSLQCRSYAVAGLFGSSYWYCVSIPYINDLCGLLI